MKKEILKEKCTAAAKKAKGYLTEHKKQVVPVVMSVAALTILISASVVFYRQAAERRSLEKDTSAVSASSAGQEEKKEKDEAERSEKEDPEEPPKEAEAKPSGPEKRADKEAEKKTAAKPAESSSPKADLPEKTEKEKTPEKEVVPEKGTAPEPEANPTEELYRNPYDAVSPVQDTSPAAVPAAETPAAEHAPSVPAENVHEHNWEPVMITIHHDAVTHVVHHGAKTQTVHHDAVTHEEPVYEYRTICNTCGADITGHIPDHIGPVCQGSYSAQQVQTGVNIVVDAEAYDEEVVVKEAYDETVTDQEAYNDVVTTGYRCSICGVTN